MRRILLDEGGPVGVRPHLQGFIVDTAAEVGWAGLVNGALITAAEQAGYEIMVTCDQNIRYQQNLATRRTALGGAGNQSLANDPGGRQHCCGSRERGAAW